MLSGNFGLESSGALSCDHKSKRPACYSWPLAFMYGRSDWIRTSDPLLPKQVRYHAAPRSVMGCFVRKRPCFGKGGPSGGRKGHCLPRAKGPSPAQDKDLRASSTQAGQLRQGAPPFQERKEHPVPLPCARGRSDFARFTTGHRRAPSVRTGKKRTVFPHAQRTGKKQGRVRARIPAPAIGVGRWPLSDRQRQKKKNPARKRGAFPYGAKDGT